MNNEDKKLRDGFRKIVAGQIYWIAARLRYMKKSAGNNALNMEMVCDQIENAAAPMGPKGRYSGGRKSFSETSLMAIIIDLQEVIRNEMPAKTKRAIKLAIKELERIGRTKYGKKELS